MTLFLGGLRQDCTINKLFKINNMFSKKKCMSNYHIMEFLFNLLKLHMEELLGEIIVIY
jgi:hypothetical protein